MEVFGHKLVEPLVYVVDRVSFRGADASLICLRRRIEPPRIEPPKSLGYWPQLAEVEPHQLGRYVQWLAGGRGDPQIDIGYVFIYFYGLERRALIDGEDVVPVAREVLRLLGIYGGNGSFNHYAVGLLARLVVSGRLKPTDKLFAKLLAFQEHRIDDVMEHMLLGYLAKAGEPLPVEWAERLAAQHELARQGDAATQAPEELSRLFRARYEQKFGAGIVPVASSKKLQLDYRAASPSLRPFELGERCLQPAVWPQIVGWRSAFQPVVDIWNDCLDELRKYARRLKAEGVLSAAAFNALPRELREDVVHPKQGAWEELLRECQVEEGAILVPVAKLAGLLDIEKRPSITLTQARSIADLANDLGFALEPDPRLTGKGMKWEHHVAVLRLEKQEDTSESGSYQLAALMLRLATEVAQADGVCDAQERARILEFLKDRLQLSTNDRARILALFEVLIRDRPGVAGLKRLVNDAFTDEHRTFLGRFLLEVAGASKGVGPEETRTLKKMFKTFGLDTGLLRTTANFGSLSSGVGQDLPEIDIERVRAIREESEKAAKLLIAAIEGAGLTDEDNESPEESATEVLDSAVEQVKASEINQSSPAPVPIATAPQRFTGLRKSLAALLDELLTKSAWDAAEFEACARRHASSTAAALDEINAWSDESLGDFLIEEGAEYKINAGLLTKV